MAQANSTLYGSVAPLRNVAALLTLIDRLQNRAHGLPGMGTFYGPSGYGKTTAATFATNRFRACHIQMQSLWKPKYFLEQIVLELGLKPQRTAAALFAQAAEGLGKTGRPLLLDEADYLANDQSIEVVRGLYETSNVPVILIGEETLPSRLQRWERVHGRMLDWVAAEKATMTDVAHLAPIYAPGVEIAEDLRTVILERSRGSIRRVSINLALAREEAARRGIAILTAARAAELGLAFFSGEAPSPRREEIAEARRAESVSKLAAHARRTA